MIASLCAEVAAASKENRLLLRPNGLPLARRLLLGQLAGMHPACSEEVMKLMLLLKTAFATAVLLLLVLMGVYNRGMVDFNLPPLVKQVVQQPAALMYFGFFAVGLVTGTVLTVGQRRSVEKPK